jgi:hypothetical protein
MNWHLQGRVAIAVAGDAFEAMGEFQQGAVCPTRSDYLQAYR